HLALEAELPPAAVTPAERHRKRELAIRELAVKRHDAALRICECSRHFLPLLLQRQRDRVLLTLDIHVPGPGDGDAPLCIVALSFRLCGHGAHSQNDCNDERKNSCHRIHWPMSPFLGRKRNPPQDDGSSPRSGEPHHPIGGCVRTVYWPCDVSVEWAAQGVRHLWRSARCRASDRRVARVS